MSFLKNLHWRFATKSFDPSKKVSDENLQKIKDAIRLAPSSFGLQSFHVDIITDQALKEKLTEVSWKQAQVTDCSHHLVFSARTDMNDRIEALLDIASGGDAEKKAEMEGYGNVMRGFAENREEGWMLNWAGKQAYIALSFAMAACSELEVDACPMEGIDAAKYDELLNHPDHIKTVVALPIGYRLEGPTYEKRRFSEEDLFS
jgi:nitroreductase/dihydropteridine reductase